MRIVFDNPETVPAPPARYSHVARVETGDGTLLFLSGQVALDAAGNLVGEGDMTAQTHHVMRGIQAILAAHGATFDNVVNIRTFLADMSLLPEYGAARVQYYGANDPTSTTVEVPRLFRDGALLEVEVVAAV